MLVARSKEMPKWKQLTRGGEENCSSLPQFQADIKEIIINLFKQVTSKPMKALPGSKNNYLMNLQEKYEASLLN